LVVLTVAYWYCFGSTYCGLLILLSFLNCYLKRANWNINVNIYWLFVWPQNTVCHRGNNCKLSVFESGKVSEIFRLVKFGVTGSCILSGIIMWVLWHVTCKWH